GVTGPRPAPPCIDLHAPRPGDAGHPPPPALTRQWASVRRDTLTRTTSRPARPAGTRAPAPPSCTRSAQPLPPPAGTVHGTAPKERYWAQDSTCTPTPPHPGGQIPQSQHSNVTTDPKLIRDAESLHLTISSATSVSRSLSAPCWAACWPTPAPRK